MNMEMKSTGIHADNGREKGAAGEAERWKGRLHLDASLTPCSTQSPGAGEGGGLGGLGRPGLTLQGLQQVGGGPAWAGAQWPGLALAAGSGHWPPTWGCRSPRRQHKSPPSPVCGWGHIVPVPAWRACSARALTPPHTRGPARARGLQTGSQIHSGPPGGNAAGEEGRGGSWDPPATWSCGTPRQRQGCWDGGARWELSLSGDSSPPWGGWGGNVHPAPVGGLSPAPRLPSAAASSSGSPLHRMLPV